MRKNNASEVISVRTYVNMLPAILRKNNGYMRRPDLIAAVEGRLASVWGRLDLEQIKVGRVRCPRWRNLMAWALVALRRQRLVKSRGHWVVLIDRDVTPPNMIRYVNRKKPRRLLGKIRRGRQSLKRRHVRRHLFDTK